MLKAPHLSFAVLLLGLAPVLLITTPPAEALGIGGFGWGGAYRACISEDLDRIDRALAGCTQLIDSPRTTRAQYQEALVRRGAIRAQQGDLSGAQTDLEAALAFNPNDARAHLAMGTVKRRLNDAEGALQAFAAAHAAANANEPMLAFSALAAAGDIRLERLEWRAAAQTFLQALEVSTSERDTTRALLGLGAARLGAGDLERAIAAFGAVEGSSAEAAIGLGESYRRSWERARQDETFSQAEAWYAEAVNRARGPSAQARALQSRAYGGLGELYLTLYDRSGDRGDLDAALSAFDSAISANALDVAALTGRARARAHLPNMRADAIADLDRAIQIAPGDANRVALRGRLLAAAGQSEAAMHDYDRALAQGGADYETYFERGLVYLSERDFVRADQNFETAHAAAEEGAFRARRDAAPALAEALVMRSRAHLAMIDAPSNRAERVAARAVGFAERALALQPYTPRYAAATCIARAVAGGEWSLAQDRCQHALQLALAAGDPRDISEAHASTGFLRLRWALAGARSQQGEAESLEAAIAAFDRALAIAPRREDEDRSQLALYRYARGVANQCLARMGPAGRDMRAALSEDRAVAARFSTYRIRPCT